MKYFNVRSYWYEPYIKIGDTLTKEHDKLRISFDLMDNFEYPLWVILQNSGNDFKVVPISLVDKNTIIISTSENAFNKWGYKTQCFKTSVNYGYACISKSSFN